MGTHTQDVTVVGWVGSDLRAYHMDGLGGVPYVQFRLASTRRVVDRQTGGFRDGPTLWFTVKAWRATAQNLQRSLVKGDPVVVVGRLGQSDWVGQDGAARSELVLEALAVGHDLGFGTAQFRRTATSPRRGPDEDGTVRTDTDTDAGPAPRRALTDDPWASDAVPSDEPPADEPPLDEPPFDLPPDGGPGDGAPGTVAADGDAAGEAAPVASDPGGDERADGPASTGRRGSARGGLALARG